MKKNNHLNKCKFCHSIYPKVRYFRGSWICPVCEKGDQEDPNKTWRSCLFDSIFVVGFLVVFLYVFKNIVLPIFE